MGYLGDQAKFVVACQIVTSACCTPLCSNDTTHVGSWVNGGALWRAVGPPQYSSLSPHLPASPLDQHEPNRLTLVENKCTIIPLGIIYHIRIIIQADDIL